MLRHLILGRALLQDAQQPRRRRPARGRAPVRLTALRHRLASWFLF